MKFWMLVKNGVPQFNIVGATYSDVEALTITLFGRTYYYEEPEKFEIKQFRLTPLV